MNFPILSIALIIVMAVSVNTTIDLDKLNQEFANYINGLKFIAPYGYNELFPKSSQKGSYFYYMDKSEDIKYFEDKFKILVENYQVSIVFEPVNIITYGGGYSHNPSATKYFKISNPKIYIDSSDLGDEGKVNDDFYKNINYPIILPYIIGKGDHPCKGFRSIDIFKKISWYNKNVVKSLQKEEEDKSKVKDNIHTSETGISLQFISDSENSPFDFKFANQIIEKINQFNGCKIMLKNYSNQIRANYDRYIVKSYKLNVHPFNNKYFSDYCELIQFIADNIEVGSDLEFNNKYILILCQVYRHIQELNGGVEVLHLRKIFDV